MTAIMRSCRFLIVVMCIIADPFSFSKAFAEVNKLGLQDIIHPLGKTEAKLSVLLSNEDQIAGFQCDLVLPNGIEAKNDGNGGYQIELARTSSNRHNVSARPMKDGSLRLLCTSLTNATFSDNSGTVLILTLEIKESLAAGSYSIGLKNTVLTDPNATRIASSDTSCNMIIVQSVKLTAKSYSREYGDANPAFGYTVEGATLDGEPEIICEATPESPVGEYSIII